MIQRIRRFAVVVLLTPCVLFAQDPIQKESDHWVRQEVQVNTFTHSSQSAATIASHTDGGFSVAWHSRRQQEGTYGVYLQPFSRNGQPIGGERQLNIFTKSMQMNPALAIDPNGTTWAAWESFGQDGSFNGIIARRFDRQMRGGDEFLVNQSTHGNQSEVVVTGLPEGGAMFVWTSISKDAKQKMIVARRYDANGLPMGNEFEIARSKQHQQLPTIATNGENLVVIWAEQDRYGRPAGIFGKKIDHSNKNQTFVVAKGKANIEPSVDLTDGNKLVVSWLQENGKEYATVARVFELNGEPATDEIRISDLDAKYVSGVAVQSTSDERIAVVWNQQTDTYGRDINLFVRTFGIDGKSLGPIVPFNQQGQGGRRRLAGASGKNRVVFREGDSQLVGAWSGPNGQDQSSVNLTALSAKRSLSFEFAKAASTSSSVSDPVAKPHEPPTFDPQMIAKNPFGGFSPLGPVGGDFGFVAINATGWDPPDPVLAVGPSHIVAMTNGAIAFFDKSGGLTFNDQIEGSGGFWGGQGATGFVFDPEVLFDPHSNRFFAMANERGSDGAAYFLLAVSDDDNPNGNWFKYRLNVTAEAGDTDIDSPNMAIDDEAVYLTADFFGPDKYLLYIIRKSELLIGASPVTTDLLVTGSQSYGIPLIYDADAPAFYMLQAFEFGNFTSLRLHGVTNQLTSPQRVTTDISVPAYGHPVDPIQQGSSTRPELFEARFWSCVYRNGSLWAVHHHSPNSSGIARARWYEIDVRGWPTSGLTPQLLQSGELTPTNNNGQASATFFPSIWVDDSGNAAITTSRSSNIEFISMSRAIRSASDPPGTFQDVQLVQPSTTQYTSGRWGDYSATVSDPVESGAFWGIHEFAQSNGVWQTFIAKYEVGSSTIAPASLNAVNGDVINGTFANLDQSDDQNVIARAAPVSNGSQRPIEISLTGNTVDTEFSQLSVIAESRVNTPNVTQTVELFNFISGQFEAIDQREIGLADESAEWEVGGDVSRFVTPGSGLFLARVSYDANGANLFFPFEVQLDRFVWQISD
ncbi:MAG: hypothetical protein AAGA30_00745 [Planctomycetota bacterium]